MKKYIYACAISALLLGIANADMPKVNPYIGIQGMYVNINTSKDKDEAVDYVKSLGYNNVIGEDNSNNLATGIVAGIEFKASKNLYLGVELQPSYIENMPDVFVDFSNGVQDGRIEVKGNYTSIPILFTTKYYVPRTNGLNIFAKGGISYNNEKISLTDEIINKELYKDTENKWLPVAAVGVGYQIKYFNIFAEYKHFWKSGDFDSFDTLSAGVTFNFGNLLQNK